MELEALKSGVIIEGPFFPEPVKIIQVQHLENGAIQIQGVGTVERKFYDPVLSPEDLTKLKLFTENKLDFGADPEGFFLFVEANRVRNAFQFDPLFAVNVSQVDPLPHQIEAVYHYILQNPRPRFLLADDPGAGKTIMAGLVLKELKLRGLVERTLIVVPGHLKDQWRREMWDRFNETFQVVDRQVIKGAFGRNVWEDFSQVITSMDFARQEDVLESLKEVTWDLVIVDEAHKLSAYRYGEKTKKTKRYILGEVLSQTSRFLLFLTATPHRGDPENFRLFLDLLEPGLFATLDLLEESVHKKENPLFLRRLKEDLKDFSGKPLFPPRKVFTPRFELSEEEKELYAAVTRYVSKHYNRAIQKEKRNVAFAMTILQRRLASSLRAVRRSLERRRNRLEELLRKAREFAFWNAEYAKRDINEEILEDLPEKERLQQEEELLEKLTSAESQEELEREIEELENLIALAKKLEQRNIETKLVQLKKVIEECGLAQDENLKLLIFTESRDTLDYLVEKIRSWGFKVTHIHGGMDLFDRIKAEHEFRHKAQVMVATEAAGEGINLQFCWLMINYDIPWNPNRLEQRMGRVHRYGQTQEVHIYNLVAADTIEGRILHRLFEKLERMKNHLGSDRVFDVIGEVVKGRNLKDLILEAIAGSRTMEEILSEIETEPDEEALRRVKEITLEALATRHLDLSRILGEERAAKENRLVPEYIEAFFVRAAKALELKLERRRDGLYRLPHVPYWLRDRGYHFKTRYGEVGQEYRVIAFDKKIASNKKAEFVAPGHPLMEALVEEIFKRYGKEIKRGAAFYDPSERLLGRIWFFEVELRDGSGEVAGKKLLALHERDGRVRELNPAVLWDLVPSKETKAKNIEVVDTPSFTPPTLQAIEAMKAYKEELLSRRRRDAEIKRRYGLKSLEYLIAQSEAKLADYETKKALGEEIPEALLARERRHREDLERKKEKLLRSIEAETHILPSEPKVLGVVQVLPLPEKEETSLGADEEIERIGMEMAMAYERKQGRRPTDVSNLNLGYDIRSEDDQGNVRYIEVKARARTGAITLTANEWFMARRLQDEYWLYIVENAGSENPELYTIQNPASRFKPEEVIGVVRYVIKDWRQVNDRSS